MFMDPVVIRKLAKNKSIVFTKSFLFPSTLLRKNVYLYIYIYIIFNAKLKTCLTTEWSKMRSGFILSQKHCKCSKDLPNCCADGWKLVFAGSKFNNKSERSYVPVEGECLAVVKALFKARYFVLGCQNLIVATDHKPLGCCVTVILKIFIIRGSSTLKKKL